MKIIISSLFLASLALTQSTSAGTNSEKIDKIQSDQKSRIIQGFNSGQLTAKEAWRLGKQQGRTYRKEHRFKADGSFTRRERSIIRRDLNKSSRRIYKQKHNRKMQGQPRSRMRNLGVNKRQPKYNRRITQGIRTGQLTRGEARRLGKQHVRILNKRRNFKSDGNFTKRERARIRKSLNHLSKRTYRLKHNNKKRH